MALLFFIAAAAQAQSERGGGAQSPLSGSVRLGDPAPEPLSLSLRAAVERGLTSNLGILLSREGVRAAEGERQESRSGLLPHLSLSTSINVQQVNVRAEEGIQFPGMPSVVGPFANFDARVHLTQSILDSQSLFRVRADREEVRAAKYSYQDVRDQVVVAVTAAYLQVVAQAARVHSSEARRATAVVLHRQALDRLEAGTTAAIDVLRARVQFHAAEQQLIAARNDLAKQKLTLARLIGLPLGQAFTVADQRLRSSVLPVGLDEALERARATRADYQMLLTRVREFELRRSAAVAASAPALSLRIDYGAIGVTPASATGTIGGFAALSIPLFQGGRVRGLITQADAAFARARAQLENLSGQIEQEVRTAFLDLQSAAEQVGVASGMVDLAGQTLEHARDRFLAGVTDNIEIIQAQEAIADADEKLIVSEYSLSLAVLELIHASGSAAAGLADFLNGR
jgi:outer membrane protein TolC